MSILLSSTGVSDVRSIVIGMAKDRPVFARRLVLELRAACAALSATPDARLEHLLDGEVRRRPLGRLSIYYRIQADEVAVVRILESARHVAALAPTAP